VKFCPNNLDLIVRYWSVHNDRHGNLNVVAIYLFCKFIVLCTT